MNIELTPTVFRGMLGVNGFFAIFTVLSVIVMGIVTYKRMSRDEKVHFWGTVCLAVISTLWLVFAYFALNGSDQTYAIVSFGEYFIVFGYPAAYIGAGMAFGLYTGSKTQR